MFVFAAIYVLVMSMVLFYSLSNNEFIGIGANNWLSGLISSPPQKQSELDLSSLIAENKYIVMAVDSLENVKDKSISEYSKNVKPYVSEYVVSPASALYENLKLYYVIYVQPKIDLVSSYIKPHYDTYAAAHIKAFQSKCSYAFEQIVEQILKCKSDVTQYVSHVIIPHYHKNVSRLALIYEKHVSGNTHYKTLVKHCTFWFETIKAYVKETCYPLFEEHKDIIVLVLLCFVIFIFYNQVMKVVKFFLKDVYDASSGINNRYKDYKDYNGANDMFASGDYQAMKDESGGINDGMEEQENAARNRTQSHQDQEVSKGYKKYQQLQDFISKSKPSSKSIDHQQEWIAEENGKQEEEPKQVGLSPRIFEEYENTSFEDSIKTDEFDDTTPEFGGIDHKFRPSSYILTDDILTDILESNEVAISNSTKSHPLSNTRTFSDISLSDPLYSISPDRSFQQDEGSIAERASKLDDMLRSGYPPSSHKSSSTPSVRKFTMLLQPGKAMSSSPTTKVNQENVYTLPGSSPESTHQYFNDLTESRLLP